jgi:hypothetical protein
VTATGGGGRRANGSKAPLRDTQEWFARAVMRGEGLDEAAQRLTAGPRLGPLERLDVYRSGYTARLVECLADDYPVLQHAMGDEPFEALCRSYIARHPSTAPNLNAYGRRMAEVCAGDGLAFEAELARLEWAMVEVIHAASAPALTMERLAAIPMEGWAEARLVGAQGVRIVETAFPVNAYFQAVKDGGVPERPAPSATTTVVYRPGRTVWRMGLSPTMAAVLRGLLAGETLERALDHAEGEAPEKVMGWFREWIASGLFVDVIAPAG